MSEEKSATPSVTYYPEYRIYKPNNAKTGAASRLQIKVKHDKYREVLLFWESSLQTGIDANKNASFGWDDPNKKVTFKMEATDIGEILAVLNGKKLFAGMPAQDGKGGAIFHQNEKGSTILKFSKMEKDGKTAYWFQLNAKRANGPVVEVKHVITVGEAEIIKILLQDAVSLMYNWK